MSALLPHLFLLLLHLFKNFFLQFPGKGEDKEYPTIGARLIRLEDKVGTLLLHSVYVFCLCESQIK